MTDLKDEMFALLNLLMFVLIIFGLLFIFAGSSSGFTMTDPNFLNGMTLVIIAGLIMFFSAFLRNRVFLG